MPRSAIQIPDERFTCQSCGRCCTRWTITADQAKVEHLRQLGWVEDNAFIKRRGSGDSFRLRMIRGRCRFLDENNHCQIHTRVGYAAKPEGCKAFPLLVGQVAGITHVRLSFYCPAVTAGTGKRLQEQQRWVEQTVKAAGEVARTAPLRLVDGLELTLRDVEQIEAALLRLLEEDGSAVGDRLAAGAALLARLGEQMRERGKAALQPTLRQASESGLPALARETYQAGKSSRAGPVLSLFLGHDCRPGAWSRAGQFFRVRLFNVGLARLRSALLEGRASRQAIQRVAFALPAPAERLLVRYLGHKLRSRRILAGELSLSAGFGLLTAAYAVANLLARLRAAAAGRGGVDEEDVIQAVQAADLLVMEHTAIYQQDMLTALTEAVLAQDQLSAALLARVACPSEHRESTIDDADANRSAAFAQQDEKGGRG